MKGGKSRKTGKKEKCRERNQKPSVSWVHALSTGCFDQCQDFEGFMTLQHLVVLRVLTFPEAPLLKNHSTE